LYNRNDFPITKTGHGSKPRLILKPAQPGLPCATQCSHAKAYLASFHEI
jgi:hypothetical protein